MTVPISPHLKPEHLQNYSQSSVCCGFHVPDLEINPEDYLGFARADQLDEDAPRSLINAVGNAKRAFHGRVEILCDVFGWRQINGKKRKPFSSRLDFLNACGVISPNILRKLNVTRNKVEHDYHVPDQSQVEDYVDVVELFLIGTKDLLRKFPESIEFELMEDEYLDRSLGLPQMVGVEITMGGGIRIVEGGRELPLSASDPDYLPWLSATISQYLL